ncbi:MAG: alpha/beta hydrolase [Bdellovibrionales bacterium]|nr:alpha/beta hydrolase [Bdellovibrionales bacterium]
MQLNVQGHKLFYISQGQGSKGLIFLHGLCGDHRVWQKNIPYFSSDFKVVALDLWGHGNSSKIIDPKEAFETLPIVLDQLIEEESLEQVVLIGHSISGNVLYAHMQRNNPKMKAYVFVDCTCNASERIVDSRNQFAQKFLTYSESELSGHVQRWYQTMMDEEVSLQDQNLILSALEKLEGNWVFEFLQVTNTLRPVIASRVPILLFESQWLTKDQPERSFVTIFPDAILERWPIAHHFFFVSHAETFNRKLIGFASEVFDVD